jgi:acyl carrier protein
MAAILERLKRIIVEELGVDEELVTSSASFADDFNASFTDLAELLTVVEERFSTPKLKVVVSDQAIDEINTVQDLIDLLREFIPED